MNFQIIQKDQKNQTNRRSLNYSLSNIRNNCHNNSLKYPIVLHHGFAGFNHIMGYSYYYNIKPFLEKHGFEVWVTSVTPLGDIQTRTRQLKNQIDKILYCSSQLNKRKISKVHLIAHSSGGLDARLLISKNTEGLTESGNPDDVVKGFDYGGKIASLTTVGAPHHGTRFADVILSLPLFIKILLHFIFTSLSKTYNRTYPQKNHYLKSLYHVSEEFCKTFNNDHPEPIDKGIVYRAFAGITNNPLPVKRNRDEADLILWLPFYILKRDPDPAKRASDGLVPVVSAKWKNDYFQKYDGGLLKADHLDQLGHIRGNTEPCFDYLAFFLYLANTLKEQQ